MNDLYEYGGSCNVVIRCNTARTIGGKQYKANEPYTILEDVFVNLGYSNTASESNAKTNVLASRQGLPDMVSITNVALTDKVNCLIAEKIVPKTIGKYYMATASQDKIIYLPETPINDNVFIYNGNTRIDDFSRQDDKIIGDFEEYESYLVFYEIQSQESCFDFETPHYGYFCLEIYGKGNTDKISKDVYIKIPAASLMSVPVFNMVNGDILYAPLQFSIVHKNQEKSYYNIGG